MRHARFLFLAFILFIFSFFASDANAQVCTSDGDCGALSNKICQNPFGLANQGTCIPDWVCDKASHDEGCTGGGCGLSTDMCIDNKIYYVSYAPALGICEPSAPGPLSGVCYVQSKVLVKDCGSPCASRCVEQDTIADAKCIGVSGPKSASCVPQPPAPDCMKVQDFKDPALCRV